jgi:D-beta-D-heptose 7-phosphate kinase/D-beta-D-heptose 1-phosphate adenosyltransferase
MLDEYVWGHIERISPEAPVPILNVVRRDFALGGAGNVAANLLRMGVKVSVVGLVGTEETGRHILDLLASLGADTNGIVSDAHRNSTRKTRAMSVEHEQQVFRLDEESVTPLRPDSEQRLVAKTNGLASGVEAIICSDYSKGVLSAAVLGAAFGIAHERKIPVMVAPKQGDAQKYDGASILMPNSRELRQLASALAVDGSSLDDSAKALVDALSLEGLVVTRGSEGMSIFQTSENGLQRFDISTTARSVFDVTGAGDTAIAAFGAAMASGADLQSAARIANTTAGIKVGKRCTATVSLEEIRTALEHGG